MIQISPERPQEVVVGNHLGQKQRTINFNIEQSKVDDYPEFTYNSVTLAPGKWDYDTIVSALVTEIYPNDRMQATVNNYLASPDDSEIKAEFDEMQGWRVQAKELATRLLEEYN